MIKTTIILLSLLIIALTAICPENCNDCDPNGNICFACKQNFELSVFGKCISNVIDKCIVYGPNNQCFACQPSFELNGNKCVKQYSGCLRKNTMNGQCYDCYFGKFLQNRVCVGSLNCQKEKAACQACMTGFELKSDGKCYDISQGCLKTGKIQGVCAVCKSGYKQIGYMCVKEEIFVPFCYIYHSETFCEICKNGYSFFENYCLLPYHIQAILNGSTTTETTIAAIRAELGMGIMKINSNSQQTASNQQNISNQSFIQIQQQSQSVNNTSFQTVNVTITNCANQNGGFCLSCLPGYILSSNACMPMDPNCSSYELASGNCVACVSGYEFDLNGICVQKQLITKIINCEVIDPKDTRLCLICTYGFYPKGNTCIKVSRLCDGHNVITGECFACLLGLDLVKGKCIDKKCNVYLNEEVCNSCVQGYKVNSNGICEFFDPNCVTLTNGKCSTCANGFYPSVNGICFKLNANCQFGNVVNEDQCAQCNSGYSLQSNGSCTQQIQTIQNCASIQNNLCQSCIQGFYLKNNTCTKVSSLCNRYNMSNGACLSCVSGYILINGNCYDFNCMIQKDEKCVQCKINYQVILPSNLCILNDPNCLNVLNNVCQKCMTGFTVGSSGLCQKIQNNETLLNNNVSGSITMITNDLTRDPNCRDYSSGKCRACSIRFYLGQDGKCIMVNAYCQNYNMAGACTSCYKGFSLINGMCVPGTQEDPNCKNRNINTSVCGECYSGYWLNGGKCTSFNPLCMTSNLSNGQCLSCYPGYILLSGACTVVSRDPSCQEFNAVTGLCSKCSFRYYKDEVRNRCMPVNILCQDYLSETGACTSCFSGYKLINGDCLLTTVINLDTNCKSYNSNQLCVQCYNGYAVRTGKCERINLLCQTTNPQTGQCISCYQGYILSNGSCVLGLQQDINCREFTDNTKRSCKVCYDQYYPKMGVCIKYNDQCKISNPTNGSCLDCYQGYTLLNGDCVIVKQLTNTMINSVPYCVKYQNNMCTKCTSGFYLNQNSQCSQVDPLCKFYNSNTGDCTQCYQGYSIKEKACVLNVQMQIPFCSLTNANGNCLQCIDGYIVKDNSCSAVSMLCGGKYNKQTGQCTGCIDGYFFQDGQCIYPAMGLDSSCERYSMGGFCEKCLLGYFLSNYKCMKVDIYCTNFDYVNSVCVECFNKTPQGANCV